jgi:ABC-2 type transport system permease protein
MCKISSIFDYHNSLFQLVLTRLREFIREPESVFWVFIFPILLAMGLGIAFISNHSIKRLPVAVVELNSTTNFVVQALANASYFSVRKITNSEIDKSLMLDHVKLIVIHKKNGEIAYRFDQSHPESQITRLLVDQVLQKAAGRKDSLKTQDILVKEIGSRYIDFLIPGLIGINLLSNGIWGVGYTIVEARKKRLLKLLISTPMSKTYYLLSYLIMGIVMMVLAVGILVIFGILAFDVPFKGSLLLFFMINILSTLMFSSMGLLIAARVNTTEGASGLMYCVMFPMWILSGVFFDSYNFPEDFQHIIRILPLTIVVDTLRNIMLYNYGVEKILDDIFIMFSWIIFTFSLSIRLFRWN